MNDTIGVLGCGWLGLPLAKYLITHKYEVYGSTTSEEKVVFLQKEGIRAYQISLSAAGIDGDIKDFLSNIDILIINLPPKLRSGNRESFVEKIKQLYSEIKTSKVLKVIFVSSTAVYGDIDGDVTESTVPKPSTESGRQLLQCEQLFQQDRDLDTTIVRFGGLIGPNRHPVNMLSKRQNLTNGSNPINLIHLDDCIHMLSTIIANNYWNQIFNGVYPLHITKKEYYTSEALKRGVSLPDYEDSSSGKNNKVIISKNFLDKNHGFQTSLLS
ncbi:NAD(P)-dependent oxidoreductase [Flagellimonas aquimarina]|uniref:NAD(P)-dependent oxidoreductase n=1 Tax=Flagellimonas aquimarina TaxID=2201895 RepID=A0A316L0G2_9FLAO|nr:SDR family oxidoreductase [Allomuricauda koreensis]PWL39594.1 NAD(P)-dependent oxidoreductase [Allomuricauda koreensis]